jgi:lipopolysaccharide biosynthesis glycosyltransferase
MLGKVVYQSNSKVERIDLSNFNSGIYLIDISTESKGKITKKLIKN